LAGANLEQVLTRLAAVLSVDEGPSGRAHRLRTARQVIVDQCLVALGQQPRCSASIAEVLRLAAAAPDPAAKRDCAFLVVHALGVPGLIPPAASADVCVLAEAGLNSALLRCSYPFAGSVAEKTHILQRLHRTIGELMQPLEPTFPNWQGLYAG
jgi:hypothetical protein